MSRKWYRIKFQIIKSQFDYFFKNIMQLEIYYIRIIIIYRNHNPWISIFNDVVMALEYIILSSLEKKYFWKFLSKRIIATPRWPQVMLCGSFMRQLWVLKEAQIGIAYRPPAIIILKKGHILFDNKMFFLCYPKIGIHIETTRKARSKTREVKSATMINLSYFLSGL